jgi:hypothetical protein
VPMILNPRWAWARAASPAPNSIGPDSDLMVSDRPVSSSMGSFAADVAFGYTFASVRQIIRRLSH